MGKPVADLITALTTFKIFGGELYAEHDELIVSVGHQQIPPEICKQLEALGWNDYEGNGEWQCFV
jgi:hypothetical protein